MPLKGNFSFEPKRRMKAKIAQDMAMSIMLANTVAPSYMAGDATANSFFMFCMNTGPFSKAPATMNVAPVSESDLANERMNAAISEGLSIGDVTVRNAMNGTAPSVLDACSYSFL